MLSGSGKFQLFDVAGSESQFTEKDLASKSFDEIEEMLRGRRHDDFECPNQVIHWLAGWIYYRALGAPDIGGYRPDAIGRAMSFVYINSNTADNPAYSTDEFNAYYRYYRDSTNFDLPWKIDGTGYYRSVKGLNSSNNNVATDICEAPKIWSETYSVGKRALYRSYKWIWLPTELNSTNINSVSICATEGADWSAPSYERYTRQVSRIRIKDSNNNMITINKNTSKVLIFEYTFRLMSL